jgi:hypothetical protein
MYLLQNYLRAGGALEELRAKYAIDATRHKIYSNLILLKYNQIESPFAEPIVREARGIILDEADNWRVVCARFSKFGNYGESYCPEIDWKTARVQEKVDGSLITLYYYDKKWNVATSGSPDATGAVGEWGFTFTELFWKTFNNMGLSTKDLGEHICPSFELTSKFNRVVVPHTESKLTLIGVHNRSLGIEYPVNSFAHMYPVVKSYPLATLEDVQEAVNKLDGLNNEGFVVVDGTSNRVKIKSPRYVALHHLKDSWGPRRIVEIVRTGEIAEVCAYFPEFADQFDDIKVRYDRLVAELNNAYEELKYIENQKEFALALVARKCPLTGAVFSLRAGKVSTIQQFIADMSIQSLMSVLGLK